MYSELATTILSLRYTMRYERLMWINIVATIGLGSQLACHAPNPSRAGTSAHRLSGMVFASEGTPATDGVVIVTNPDTTDEIKIVRTDSRGHFELDSPVPQVALTAATTRQWAFLPKVEVDRGEVAIRLSSSCASIHGQIKLDDPLPSTHLAYLRLGRLGNNVGDMFGAIVDSEHNFEACLPSAEYYLVLPSEFVERTILTAIPWSKHLVIHSASRRRVDTPPASPLDVAPVSRDAFVSGLPSSVRVLGLAESNHGTYQFTDERSRLSLALARQQRFNLILIEAGYGETLAIDDYIQGADIDITAALARLGYWMWGANVFLDSLNAFREYNRTALPEQRVSLLGVDVQTTKGAVDDLLKASELAFSQEDITLLSRLRERNGAPWRDFIPDERSSIRQVLERIATHRDEDRFASARSRHALSARSILLCLDYLEAQGLWNESRVRDKGIAQMVGQILDLAPHLRATVWGHLAHLSREYVVGAPTAGEHLAASLRNGYRVYALLAYQGAARARGIEKDARVTTHSLAKPPVYSLEGALALSTSTPIGNVTYWTFEHANSINQRWLQELHWIRSFGAIYPGDQASFEIYNLGSLDGAVLFGNVTPSEPIATNKRPVSASP